jgi:ATP/ADP translocase/HEAT repeat protein
MLLRLGLDVRREERELTLLLSASFFLVIAFQSVARAVRQATYVDAHGATSLPWVYLLVALCSYPLLRLYVKWANRVSPHEVMGWTEAAAALSTLAFWWLYGKAWSWVPVAFYIWAAIVFVMLVSQFWSFAVHVLDARQAKRLVGPLGTGGLLGGIAGGQIARMGTAAVGTRHTLLFASAVILLGVAVIALLRRSSPAGEKHQKSAGRAEASPAGFGEIFRSSHLRLVALLILTSVAVTQIVDLQFNWAVERATTSLHERTQWFGNFVSLLSLVALAFQLFLTARIHATVGVGVAMQILPATIGLGSLAILLASGFAPGLLLPAVLALKVGESGVRYSVDQSTRELLFLPVPAPIRARVKAVLDVLLLRSAEGLAAVLLLPVAFGLLDPVQVSWLTLALVVGWLLAAGGAYRTYVGSFRESLKERTLDAVVPINLSDIKTVELLVQSLGSADSRQVLHSLDVLDKNGRGHLVPPLLLYHDDAEVRRRTLQVLAGADRKDATPLVERRLGDESHEVRAEAIRVLTAFNAVEASALMLPRLREADPKVRAAAIACLINHGEEPGAEKARLALRDMLYDASPESRAEALRAIGAIRTGEYDSFLIQGLDDPDPAVAREGIYAVRRVVERVGFNPLCLPRLLSLLSNRRLKLDAREALVSFGSDAVPILAHFMRDREESIFVRRAIPKTLARIGGGGAVSALVESLAEAEDAFLRAQIVEALAIRRDELANLGLAPKVEREVEVEAQSYLRRLAELAGVTGDESLLQGPLPRWDRREQNLLAQMLAERMEDHLRTLFGLLALLYPPHDVWAAHRSLLSGKRMLRAHALEYLENRLSGSVRRRVFAVIGDVAVNEKLRTAARELGIERPSLGEVVERLLDEGRNGDADARALSVAALYTVHTEQLLGCFPLVSSLLDASRDPLVRETAGWVKDRGAATPARR